MPHRFFRDELYQRDRYSFHCGGRIIWVVWFYLLILLSLLTYIILLDQNLPYYFLFPIRSHQITSNQVSLLTCVCVCLSVLWLWIWLGLFAWVWLKGYVLCVKILVASFIHSFIHNGMLKRSILCRYLLFLWIHRCIIQAITWRQNFTTPIPILPSYSLPTVWCQGAIDDPLE